MNNKTGKNFNFYFENKDLAQYEYYSFSIVKSLIRSILEPMAASNQKGFIITHIKDIPETKSLMKRLEYSNDVHVAEFSDFEFSKFDIEKFGFIILTSQRYNAVLLFRKKTEDKYEIYVKFNSKCVNEVYETLKSVFSVDYDKEFYEFKPERRENELLNRAFENILKQYEETIQEGIYNVKIQENYKSVNAKNTTLRNEMYQNVRQIAHEIKNQLSILDIYTRIFEKKTGDTSTIEPIRKSVNLIKSQIEQFKNFDVVNLQEKDVKTIIQDAIKLYTNILKEKNNKLILIDEMAGVEASAFLDEEKLLIVAGNIIKNANDSTHDDEIIVKISRVKEKIKISFINHGDAIENSEKDKIFDSGYTTKKDGWGVGLAVCKKYIGSQFGTFELEKSDNNETIFSILLPLVHTK